MEPGEYYVGDGMIAANQNKATMSMDVSNTGDRPIQVGSHTHFFEVNRALSFRRSQSYGFRLNIPSGTSVRFEPGDTRTVELVEYGGRRIVYGFGGLANGPLDDGVDDAMAKARQGGYKGA